MSECTHNCETCGSDCAERNVPRTAESLLAPSNELSNVKKVIAVVSGKGGVGKSLVTSLLAVGAKRRGFATAVFDADVTGPSVPKMFGIHGQAEGDGERLYPAKTAGGIEVMSVNLLLANESDPVVWRGPVIAGVVKQFWTDVVWNDVDYMFVDMPPGTGDVPLTVFQSLPVDGIVVVTSPQELVSMIVEKAVKMAEMMNIPVLGLVENLSYFICGECGKKHAIFGESHIEETAKRFGIDATARIPIDPALTKLGDTGRVEEYSGYLLTDIEKKIFGE